MFSMRLFGATSGSTRRGRPARASGRPRIERVLACVGVAALACARALADSDADALYWLAPGVVAELPASARDDLASLAADVVAGRVAGAGVEAAVERVLADVPPSLAADAEWLRRYAAWELRFVAGDVDLRPETLRSLAERPCCELGPAWRRAFAVEVGERSRALGADPAPAMAAIVSEAEADDDVLAVLAHANLDRGHTPEAQAQLVRTQNECTGGCVESGRTLVARARAAFFAARFEEATTLARDGFGSLMLAERHDWIATLPSLAEVADLYSELKDADAAARAVAVAHERSDALLVPRHPYAFAVAAAEFLSVVEDYESSTAAAKHDALVARFGAALDENALAVMQIRIDEAALEWLRGEYAPAAEHSAAAVARVEQALGGSAPRLADALIVRGLACSGLGDIDCVLAVLRRALDIRERIFTFPQPLVAEAQNNLAVNLHDIGRYDLAEPLMQSVVDIDRAYYGTDNEEVASDIHNLASLYRAMGDAPRAVELLKEALAIDERELGPRHLRTGIMLNGLGQAYLEARDWQDAYDSFERSAEIQGAVDPMSRGVPIANQNRATAALELGRPQVALELLEPTIPRYEDPKGQDWRKASVAHRELARALAMLGRNEEASAQLARAAEIAPLADAPDVHWRTFMAIAGEDQDRRNERSAVFFGKLALEVLQQMRSTQSTLERPLQVDFLKNRADSYRRVVGWLVDLGRLSEAHAVRAMLGEEEYFEFTRRLRAASSHTVPFTPFEREQHERLQAAWDDVHAKRAEPAVYGRVLADVRAAFAALAPADTPRREPGEQAMPATAALVDYVVEDARTTMIVLTASGRFAAKSDIDRRELRARVFELREALASPSGDPRAAAQDLYRVLVAPIERELERAGVTTLWVSADDVLRYLPFAALDDGRTHLGERFGLASVSPFAAPAHAEEPPKIAAFAVSHAVGGYAALPATEAEVDAIVRTDSRDPRGALPGRIWLNEAFDRAGLRNALQSDFDIVHVASHFEFAPGNETDSFLLLGTGERLPLSELRTGDYPLEHLALLTMSGCDTVGASEEADGREIDGFAALASSKGARYVLATLWSIDDERTAALMGRFYGALARGADPVAALTEARRAFAHEHPFYWAPFVLWGTP
jgi:CHAT domain-containing protein/tetratricopeptide (TPR) repeat protein